MKKRKYLHGGNIIVEQKSNRSLQSEHIRSAILLAITLLLCLAALFIPADLVTYLLIVLLLLWGFQFCVNMINSKSWEATFRRDPQRYVERLRQNKKLRNSTQGRLAIAEHSGDYLTQVSLHTDLARKSRSIPAKCESLVSLASIYFLLGDDEKLAQICDAFERVVSGSKQEQPIRQNITVFLFYREFLTGQWDACIHRCNTLINVLRAHGEENSPIFGWIHYRLGTVYQRMENRTDAAKHMEKVLDYVPSTWLGNRAAEHLQAMDIGASAAPAVLDLLPDPSIRATEERRLRGFLLRMLAVAGVLLVLAIPKQLLIEKFPALGGKEYAEASLYYQPIREKYGTIHVKKDHMITENGKDLDQICLFESEGKLHLVSMVIYNGTTSACVPYVEDLQPETDYTIESVTSDYTFVVRLVEQKQSIPDRSHATLRFRQNEKTLYLVIVKVTPQG